MRKISFEAAKARYVHRYTMEHIPSWAKVPMSTGKFYAPQFRSDSEWYENTRFPGEEGHIGDRQHCFTTNQTWPLGKWLDKPFQRGIKV